MSDICADDCPFESRRSPWPTPRRGGSVLKTGQLMADHDRVLSAPATLTYDPAKDGQDSCRVISQECWNPRECPADSLVGPLRWDLDF
jgi:hypothetical protein